MKRVTLTSPNYSTPMRRQTRLSQLPLRVILRKFDNSSKEVCTHDSSIVYLFVPRVLILENDLTSDKGQQARSQGGVGGVVRPPPVAHPKDFVPPFSNFVPPFNNFVPPFSNFVPPFSNFVPPFSNFVPPFSNFVPPSSNFVPPFSNFVPPLEYVDDVTRAMSKGGGACECPRVGAFFKLMTSRGQCPRGGGAPGVPPIQVQTPPPGWLATGLGQSCKLY